MTWVLILTIPLQSLAAVPGYTSEAQCLAAGRAWAQNAGWGTKAGYRCIPGPATRQEGY
jgi:hypothetical protein